MAQVMIIKRSGKIGTAAIAVPDTAEIAIPLPSAADEAAWTSYVTSLIALVVGAIVAFSPGWTEPPWLTGLAPLVGMAIACGVQVYNFLSHRSAKTTLLAAYADVIVAIKKL